eukprot:4004295-Ditylum_brightwellii.AAC.1
MAASNSFDQLVFYLEACESGSMFNGLLPDNINIYTTTASTPFESSYGCDCDVAGPVSLIVVAYIAMDPGFGK